MTNLGSITLKNNTNEIIPDYIIFEKISEWHIEPHRRNTTQYKDLMVLLEPNNEKIPSNFEMMWKSDKRDIIVYRINK
jgi:hypothetical protein